MAKNKKNKKKMKKKGRKIKATVKNKKSSGFVKIPDFSKFVKKDEKQEAIPPDRVGSFGDVIFKCSKKAALLPQNISSSQAGVWAEHERIGKKSNSEFLHEDIFKITLDITLIVGFGYKPYSMMLKIREYVKKGKIFPLILGGKNICSKMAIKDCSENWDVIMNNGKVMQATVTLNFEEVI